MRAPCEPFLFPFPQRPERQENARFLGRLVSTATGIRTRVSAMRGRRPSPLDDSGAKSVGSRLAKRSERVMPPSAGIVGPERTCSPPLPVVGALSSLARTRAGVAELVDAHGSGPC